MCSSVMRLPRLFAKWNTEGQRVAKEDGPYTYISTKVHKPAMHQAYKLKRNCTRQVLASGQVRSS